MDETRAIRPAFRKPRRPLALAHLGRVPVRSCRGIGKALPQSTASARQATLSAGRAQQNTQDDAFDLPSKALRRLDDQAASAADPQAARGHP